MSGLAELFYLTTPIISFSAAPTVSYLCIVHEAIPDRKWELIRDSASSTAGWHERFIMLVEQILRIRKQGRGRVVRENKS